MKESETSSSSPATSPPPSVRKPSPTSRLSATTSTTTSKPAKPTSTRVCGDGPRTSCRCSGERGRKRRTLGRSARRLQEGRLRYRLRCCGRNFFNFTCVSNKYISLCPSSYLLFLLLKYNFNFPEMLADIGDGGGESVRIGLRQIHR